MNLKAKFFSLTNFNPVALLSLIVLVIGVILGAVSIGIGADWSRLETVRLNEGVPDGSTVKNVGLLSRCVQYMVTTEIEELGLSLDQQPSRRCVSIGDVNCSLAGPLLISALDQFSHPEIQNSNDADSCTQVKGNLQTSAVLMIVSVVLSFISLLLFLPLFHWVVIIVADVLTLFTVVLYAAALGVYVDTEQHFAGFFSLNGAEQNGCLSTGFGLALAALIVNIIAGVIGFVAIVYGICFKKSVKEI